MKSLKSPTSVRGPPCTLRSEKGAVISGIFIKKTYLTFFLLIVLLLFNINFGEARLGNFLQGECAELKTISNSSTVNISTISYPNLTVAVTNQVMEKNGKTFNFTFCDTDVIGFYIYDFFDAEGNVFVNDFQITPIADNIDTGSSIVYIIILTTIIIFFAFFFVVAVRAPYKNVEETNGRMTMITKVTPSKYVKLMAIWLSYGMFLWFVVVVTGLTNNYIKFEALKTLTTNLYLFFRTVGYGLSVSIIWLLFWNGWKDIILNKTIIDEGKAILNKF